MSPISVADIFSEPFVGKRGLLSRDTAASSIEISLLSHTMSLHKSSDQPWKFQIEPDLSIDEFIDVLKRSTLGARRPLENRDVISGMLRAADVIGTVRTPEGLLIAVGRALTDFCYVTYLSDLAVDEAYQRRGIGQKLLKFTHDAAGATTRLILIAAPAAESYYPRIGLVKHPSCWMAEPGWADSRNT